MMLELSIEIVMSDENMCRSVLNAVEPDNKTAPSSITIDVTCQGNVMKILVRGSNTKILTFRNTVDDLLEHVSIAMKTVNEVHSASTS
ncbi:MAG: KEOPS complex subunit Pcc1 [Ignisphaera sp.]